MFSKYLKNAYFIYYCWNVKTTIFWSEIYLIYWSKVCNKYNSLVNWCIQWKYQKTFPFAWSSLLLQILLIQTELFSLGNIVFFLKTFPCKQWKEHVDTEYVMYVTAKGEIKQFRTSMILDHITQRSSVIWPIPYEFKCFIAHEYGIILMIHTYLIMVSLDSFGLQ